MKFITVIRALALSLLFVQGVTLFPVEIIKDPMLVMLENCTIHIMQGDIVRGTYNDGKDTFSVDAIVNAANRQLARGGGVCGAIFQAAEGNSTVLQDFIRAKYPHGIKTGQAVMTPSFRLQEKGIKKIIHAVGPIYNEYSDKKEAEQLLKNAYINSLKAAEENQLTSIAFPFISSAIYGYPKPEAAQIAFNAIEEYCDTHKNSPIKDIYVVLFLQEDYDVFLYTFTDMILQFRTMEGCGPNSIDKLKLAQELNQDLPKICALEKESHDPLDFTALSRNFKKMSQGNKYLEEDLRNLYSPFNKNDVFCSLKAFCKLWQLEELINEII